MATIVATNANQNGTVAVTETTLTGTLDTFTYRNGVKQTLILRNPTAGAISPVIDGSGATTLGVEGVGIIDISTGFAVGSIAAGAVKSIRTDSIARYLAGTIAITSGTDLVATLIES